MTATCPTRPLGQTGIHVPLLGLGTVKMGRTQGLKYPHPFELPDDASCCHLLQTAKDYGVNLIDTAPAYGTSEIRLGQLLYSIAPRSEWLLSSKAGEFFEAGQSRFDFSVPSLLNSVHDSLRRLRTDYLDILLLHSDGQDEKHLADERIWSLLQSLKQQGKVRSYGMSTKTVEGGLMTLERSDLAMVFYAPHHRTQETVLEMAHAQQKGLLIKKALESGWHPEPSEALRHVVQQQGVSSVIVGTLNTRHLEENVAAVLQTVW